MQKLIIPSGYESKLSIKETEQAIKDIRVYFENELSSALNLKRVSAPLFVEPETGLNDNLNGVERPVSFDILEQNGKVVEIVHSLAKWKRMALGRYGFSVGEGLYTNMNAIRRDESTDNLHSIYVDQWDWEKVITKEQRNMETLESVVNTIYSVVKLTEKFVCEKYGYKEILPEQITFITTQQMEDEYPNVSPHNRENIYAKKYGAIFVCQIGAPLKSGKLHDGRAADYDDWKLNGDIVLYYPVLERAFELSSMGIRVDSCALKEQLSIRKTPEKINLPFQWAVANETVPLTIGGGIGQSRLCMFLLRKAHIGEVQSSVWPPEMERICNENGINLL